MEKDTAIIDKKLTTLWQNRDKDWEEELNISRQLWQESLSIDYIQGKIGALVLQANSFTWLNQVQEAFNALDRAIDLLSLENITPWSIRLHFVYGTLYRNFGDLSQALEHNLTALDYAEALGDTDGLALAKGNIALIHLRLQEYEKAIEGFQQILKNKHIPSNSQRLFSSYLNLATAYYYIKQPNQAIAMASKALELATTEHLAVKAHGNLGAAYLIDKKFDEAKYHLEKSYTLSIESEDPITQCVCGVDLADYFIETGENKKSRDLLLHALGLAQSADYKQGEKDCHQRLYAIYQKQENWKQALHHHEALYQVDREIFNENSDKRIRNLEVLHKVDEIHKINDRQNQEHQRLSEMKDALLRDVSHDLRNPLSVIFTSVYILRKYTAKNKDADDRISELCDTIERQSNRMLQLITDVLDMARLEASSDVDFQHINLTDLVTELWTDFQDYAETKNIVINLTQSETFSMMGNKNSLHLMLSNLIGNAIKYTKSGGTVNVSMSYVEKKHFRIKVKDTGIGIPKEALPKIFDLFYRAPAHLEFAGGTGLGLAIVKRAVGIHKGTIEVTSKAGEGTEFSITFQSK